MFYIYYVKGGRKIISNSRWSKYDAAKSAAQDRAYYDGKLWKVGEES